MKKTGLKGHFYLLGYESGVIVALEMAKILEEQEGKGLQYKKAVNLLNLYYK